MASSYERGDNMISKEKLPICVIKAIGTNCDSETAYSFEQAGGGPRVVHINSLKEGRDNLKNFKIAAFPGGFADGDYGGGAGRIAALNLKTHLKDQLLEFRERGGLIIGICNGFQVLTETGLLPFGELGKRQVVLDVNDVGHFDNRWVSLKFEKGNRCVFLKDVGDEEETVVFQTAHREGKFFAEQDVLEKIEQQNLVVLRYCDAQGVPVQDFPDNPNGSLNAIAGITDESGKIFGLMPHPERGEKTKDGGLKPHGLIFERMVSYAKQM